MTALRDLWTLDPTISFLNHGSFGACPRAVLDRQTELRARLEREPVRFFFHELEPLLEEARARVAAFVVARPEDVLFVRNATSGVNAVLRSLRFAPGDELLTTSHVYGACKNTLEYVASRAGARLVVARVPFPVSSENEVLDAIVGAVGPRTRLALIDHVTSATGLVFPIDRIVRELDRRGVDTLVDGAHAPGMVELDLTALGAAYYTANFHKWTCAPKGAALLWARADRQEGLHPAVISHGLASERPRKRLLEEFDWTGTDDPTPWLCVPFAIDYVGGLVEGGWPAVRAQNRALALAGRALLLDALGLAPPSPASMIGALAAVPIPDGPDVPPMSVFRVDPLQRVLMDEHRIEVPVPPWPAPPKRLIRISAHLHNDEDEYRRLSVALRHALSL